MLSAAGPKGSMGGAFMELGGWESHEKVGAEMNSQGFLRGYSEMQRRFLAEAAQKKLLIIRLQSFQWNIDKIPQNHV